MVHLMVGASDLFERVGREWLDQAPVTPGTRREITVQLAVIAALEEQLRGYERRRRLPRVSVIE